MAAAVSCLSCSYRRLQRVWLLPLTSNTQQQKFQPRHSHSCRDCKRRGVCRCGPSCGKLPPTNQSTNWRVAVASTCSIDPFIQHQLPPILAREHKQCSHKGCCCPPREALLWELCRFGNTGRRSSPGHAPPGFVIWMWLLPQLWDPPAARYGAPVLPQEQQLPAQVRVPFKACGQTDCGQ